MKRFFLMMALVLSVGFANAQNETQADKQVVDVEQIREKANQGDADAQAQMGSFYFMGKNGVAKDINQALSWYKKSVENGNGKAALALGSFYHFGKGGVTEDLNEAIKWYTKALDLGETNARMIISMCKKKLEEPSPVVSSIEIKKQTERPVDSTIDNLVYSLNRDGNRLLVDDYLNYPLYIRIPAESSYKGETYPVTSLTCEKDVEYMEMTNSKKELNCRFMKVNPKITNLYVGRPLEGYYLCVKNLVVGDNMDDISSILHHIHFDEEANPSVILLSKTPQKGGEVIKKSNINGNDYSISYKITIYVPQGCKEAYRSSPEWGMYGTHIVEYSSSMPALNFFNEVSDKNYSESFAIFAEKYSGNEDLANAVKNGENMTNVLVKMKDQKSAELAAQHEAILNTYKQRAIQKKDKALTFAIANGYEKGGKQGLPNMETGHYEYCEFVQSDDSAMVWYKKDVAFGGDPCNVERLNLYWVSKIIENHRKTIKLADSYLPKYTKKYGATNGTALYKGQFTGLSLAQVNEFVKDLNAMDNHYILRASEPPIDDVIRYGRGVQIYTIILQDGLLPVQTTFKVLNGKVVAQRDDNYKGMEGMKWFSTEALDNYKNDGWIHRLERIKEK